MPRQVNILNNDNNARTTGDTPSKPSKDSRTKKPTAKPGKLPPIDIVAEEEVPVINGSLDYLTSQTDCESQEQK